MSQYNNKLIDIMLINIFVHLFYSNNYQTNVIGLSEIKAVDNLSANSPSYASPTSVMLHRKLAQKKPNPPYSPEHVLPKRLEVTLPKSDVKFTFFGCEMTMKPKVLNKNDQRSLKDKMKDNYEQTKMV